jgi:hypothetical protein
MIRLGVTEPVRIGNVSRFVKGLGDFFIVLSGLNLNRCPAVCCNVEVIRAVAAIVGSFAFDGEDFVGWLG